MTRSATSMVKPNRIAAGNCSTWNQSYCRRKMAIWMSTKMKFMMMVVVPTDSPEISEVT